MFLDGEVDVCGIGRLPVRFTVQTVVGRAVRFGSVPLDRSADERPDSGRLMVACDDTDQIARVFRWI